MASIKNITMRAVRSAGDVQKVGKFVAWRNTLAPSAGHLPLDLTLNLSDFSNKATVRHLVFVEHAFRPPTKSTVVKETDVWVRGQMSGHAVAQEAGRV